MICARADFIRCAQWNAGAVIQCCIRTVGPNGGGSGGWGDTILDNVKCMIGNIPDQLSEAIFGGCVTYTDEN